MKKLFQGLSFFQNIEPIEKGWSSDQKYHITQNNGHEYLLRLSPLSTIERQRTQFELMKQAATLAIPMCMPIEFGVWDNNTYVLHSWIRGQDLELILPKLSEMEQYKLGRKAGKILKHLHTIPAPASLKNWDDRFNRKTDLRLNNYFEGAIRFAGDDNILRYLQKNRHLLKNRPQCFQHGDYHVGNMMLKDNTLHIIDFDRFDFGDPWEEFNRIVWSATLSPQFATGQLQGYFEGDPPTEFFQLLTFYIASNTISAINWAIPYGNESVATILKQTKDILSWFNDMKNPVPTWYLKDFVCD